MRVKKFFDESNGKFATRRQASKYLSGFGKIYKEEHDIPLTWSKRQPFVEMPLTKKEK